MPNSNSSNVMADRKSWLLGWPAAHWRTAMEQDPSTKDIVSEAGQANPEKYVQQTFQEEVPSADEGLDAYENPEPDDFNPFVEGEEDGDGEEDEEEEDEQVEEEEDD